MQYTPAVKPADPHLVQQAARSAVLLIFIMPSTPTSQSQRTSLMTLANSLQGQLNDLLRVLCIDADSHADVVRSFAITQMPAFVLVRQGVELWRQEGLSDEATLVRVIQGLLMDQP